MSETAPESDKKAVEAIVKEMAESMSGAQSTRHWAKDALWFDIPAFASKGVTPAKEFFDKVFATFESCKVEFLLLDVMISGSMAVACSVQRVNVVLKGGGTKSMVVRETDCFEKKPRGWELTHQHASLPAGGAWDGNIVQG